MRTMFDSTTPWDIPADAQLVMGYVNGQYAWRAQDWRRFPVMRRVALSVSAFYFHAIVLDVEGQDASPDQANGWVIGAARASGWVPTLYGSEATLDRCKVLIAEARLDCDYALADPDGIPHLPAGYGVCQYAWPDRGSPGHFDMSVVADWWPRKVGSPKRV
jgi:hypothetical protein